LTCFVTQPKYDWLNPTEAVKRKSVKKNSFFICYKFIEFIICSVCAVEKNGSFGFAKGRLVCRAKPNVPFVRLAKIVFKKCAVGKNKNTEALAFGSAVCWFICPVTLCLFLSFILAVSSFRLAGNAQRLGEGREVKHKFLAEALKPAFCQTVVGRS